MRLKIHHETHYTYDAAPSYLVQRLQLQPIDFATQRTQSWAITAPGFEKGLAYTDGFGNLTHLITMLGHMGEVVITASGEVETEDASGLVKGLPITVPDVVYLRRTITTQPDAALINVAERVSKQPNVLKLAHDLMAEVHEKVVYLVGASDVQTTAAEAFAAKRGVCQDHAHIMVTVARHLGIPARYVTGYLVTGVGASSSAAHAWAEFLVPDLGWVGFDAANGQCPTEHYVRVASGLDAASVAPVRGTRRGGSGPEHMRVEVRVEISQQ
jgi:transglutaminase-like putative cysteine protease